MFENDPNNNLDATLDEHRSGYALYYYAWAASKFNAIPTDMRYDIVAAIIWK